MPNPFFARAGLTIFLILVTINTHSSNCNKEERSRCSYYRLDEGGPWGVPETANKVGTMENIQSKNQRERGYCYAFSATDMFEAIYQAENPTFKDFPIVNPVYTAFQYAGNKNIFLRLADKLTEKLTDRVPGEGGFTCDAVNILLKKGYCPQTEIDEKNNLYEGIMYLQSGKKDLQKSKKIYSEIANPENAKNIEIETLRLNTESFEEKLKADTFQILCKNSPSAIAFRKFVGDMSAFLSYESTQFEKLEGLYNEYIKKTCEKSLKKLNSQKYSCISEDFQKTADLQDYLRKTKSYFNHLVKDQIENPPAFPIELAICGKILKRGLEEQHLNVGFGIQQGKECGPHTVIVMGRKWDDNNCTCKLLMKNSWEQVCLYPTKKIVEKYKNPEEKKLWTTYVERGWECDSSEKGVENGLFWANQEDILKNTLSISHISNSQK